MDKFSVKMFVDSSIEEGYASNKDQAYQAIVKSVTDCFVDKLNASGIKIANGERVEVGIITSDDSVFVRFRNKFFEVGLNRALIESDPEPEKPFLFYEANDRKRIDLFKKCIDEVSKSVRKELNEKWLSGTMLGVLGAKEYVQ